MEQPKEPPNDPYDFFESMSTMDDLIQYQGHTIEECGMCYHNYIMAEVAREMRGQEKTIGEWSAEVKRRWHESKYYKLYQEEKTAGRNPADAFTARGWEM